MSINELLWRNIITDLNEFGKQLEIFKMKIKKANREGELNSTLKSSEELEPAEEKTQFKIGEYFENAYLKKFVPLHK